MSDTQKRYYAEKFELRCNFDNVPFVVRMRLLLDRENKRVRAVRSVSVVAEDGSKLPTTSDAYIDEQELAR